VGAERVIRQAFEARRRLALSYEGDRGPPRIVHPQVLYRTLAGDLLLDSFQISGPSRSGGPLPGWRAFELARIQRVELSEGDLRVAPGLELGSPKYATVLAHV
jgi:hypothetical protein